MEKNEVIPASTIRRWNKQKRVENADANDTSVRISVEDDDVAVEIYKVKY